MPIRGPGASLSVHAVLIGYKRASMRELKDDIDAARREAKTDIEKVLPHTHVVHVLRMWTHYE